MLGAEIISDEAGSDHPKTRQSGQNPFKTSHFLSHGFSGEAILHHENVYIVAQQSAFGGEGGAATGLLVRTCEGRKDYTGGRNHMMHLRELDDPEALALKVVTISPSVRPDVVTDQDDPNYGMGLRP